MVVELEGYKPNSLVRRLENLGYLTSREINHQVAVARPVGIEITNGEAKICAKRKLHNEFI